MNLQREPELRAKLKEIVERGLDHDRAPIDPDKPRRPQVQAWIAEWNEKKLDDIMALLNTATTDGRREGAEGLSKTLKKRNTNYALEAKPTIRVYEIFDDGLAEYKKELDG